MRNKGQRTEEERDKCSADGRPWRKIRPACVFRFSPGSAVRYQQGARKESPAERRTPPFCGVFSAGQNSQDALITLTLFNGLSRGEASGCFRRLMYYLILKILLDSFSRIDSLIPHGAKKIMAGISGLFLDSLIHTGI